MVQHISSFTRFWNSKDWNYSFTQEWPVPEMNATNSATRWWLCTPERFLTPGRHRRCCLELPLPVGGKRRHAHRLLASRQPDPSHRRFIPGTGRGQFRCADQSSVERRSQSETGQPLECRRDVLSSCSGLASAIAPRSAGYNVGQSFIWLVHARFNVMLETCVCPVAAVVVAKNRTEWSNSFFLSPGIRWAHNFKNGLQIVPGIGVPLGDRAECGRKRLLLYLSFEHPFRKLPKS